MFFGGRVLKTVIISFDLYFSVLTVPPSFVEYTRPQEIHKNEGEQVELFCNATGIPAPVVTWWRQNYYTSGTREREYVPPFSFRASGRPSYTIATSGNFVGEAERPGPHSSI